MADESRFFSRLRQGLKKTREGLLGRLETFIVGAPLEVAQLDEVEEALLAADLGPRCTAEVMEAARAVVVRREVTTIEELRAHLARHIGRLFTPPPPARPAAVPPRVALFVGTNGSGKTTTIAKLAKRHRDADEGVLLAAGDTFRAAAIEQLQLWGRRIGVDVVAHRAGADPAAVVFDACRAAAARGTAHLLIDTAGRLHTKANLMEELKKIHRVIGREVPGAPHDTFLVLDATTGLNALVQARQFHQAVSISGLIVTKLDGTAKGGAILAIAQDLGIPVRYVGVGESPEDLQPFDPQAFGAALFS